MISLLYQQIELIRAFCVYKTGYKGQDIAQKVLRRIIQSEEAEVRILI